MPGGPSDRRYDDQGRPAARPQQRPAESAPAWPWATPATGNAPEAPPPKRRGLGRRGTIAVVLSVVLTLVIGGGAVAFYSLDPFHIFRPGPQPAEAVPANALAYVSVDLDPMAAQKVDALRFLNAFPGFRDQADVSATSDVRETLLTAALKSENCSGIRYTRDIEPWLGQRMAFAMMPRTAHFKEPYAYLVQVSDEAAARHGVATVTRRCLVDSSRRNAPGVAFSHGFMVLAPTQPQARTYAEAADASSLADNPQFTADMTALGDPGVITAWVDVKRLIRSVEPDLASNSTLKVALRNSQRLAATFRFRSDAVEIEASMYGANFAVPHGYNPVVRLPDSTVFALSESGGEQRVGRLWNQTLDQLRGEDPEIDRQLNQIQQQTGLLLPEDLRTLLGQNVLFALDSKGLTSSSSVDDLTGLTLGARFTNHPAKLNALYAKIIRLVGHGHAGRLPFVKKTFADGVAIASNPHYAEHLGRLDGHLGDSPDFRSVVGDASTKESVLYFDFDAVQDQILRQLKAEGVPQGVLDNLRPLRAFGVSSDVSGRYQQLTMRLSIDD
jgi:hypothetical protein